MEGDAAHGFRRALHGFGATFIVYYLIPDAGAWGVAKRVLPPLLVLAAVAVEVARLRGAFRSEALFGLREYERRRVGAYVHFGLAALVLLTFAPQAIAIPCLVGMALLDPLHGELRARGRGRAAVALGWALATLLFALAGWSVPWALLGGAAMALGEVLNVPGVDDDFLMGILPAVALGAATLAGATAVPSDLLAPWGWP